MKTKLLFFILPLTFISLNLLAAPQKEILAVDFSKGAGYSFSSQDVTKLQDKDLPEKVRALKVGDSIVFKTDLNVYTGRVTLAYRDVNMVETRAGYFNNHSPANNEIFHFTYDRDAMVGWIEDTYLAKEYSILYTAATGTLSVSSEDSREFSCGNDQEVSHLELGEEEKARLASQAKLNSLTAAPAYDDIWKNPEYVTQKYLICYTKEAYEKSKKKGGINHLMAHGIAHGTLLLSNSHVRACLSLGHSALLDYENHGNSSKSLSDFSNCKNGCEPAFNMRNAYGCDMCSIGIMNASYTGLASVNGSETGSESIPFNCMDSDFLNATGWVHEDGHNMGGRHYIDTYSPGSSSLFGHSFGCHNTPPGAQREQGSVMARSNGLFNYFASTNIYYDGVPISTNVKCRVADTWEKVRRYAARYRGTPVHADIEGMVCAEEFDYPAGESLMWQQGGAGFAADWTNCDTNIFKIAADDREDLLPGQGNVLKIDNAGNDTQQIRRTIYWDMPGLPSYQNFKNGLWLRFAVKPESDKLLRVYFGGSFYMAVNGGRVRINTSYADCPLAMNQWNDVLVRADMKSDMVYLWINPDMSKEPELSSASTNRYISAKAVFPKIEYLKLEAFSGFAGCVDSYGMAYDFEALKYQVRPRNFTVLEGGYTNTAVRMNWQNVGIPESIEIYRGRSKDFAEAEKLAVLPLTNCYEDATAEAGLKHYYWLKAIYSDHEFVTPPQRGLIGLPENSVCIGGEYTVGQLQRPVLSAAGSEGYNLMVRWTIGKEDTVFSTNNLAFTYFGRQLLTPGDYPVKVEVTERDYDGEILSASTVLHVTNSYPKVTIESDEAPFMVGVSKVFTALPYDPGTNDTFKVCWSFEGGEYGPWTNSFLAIYTFANGGSQPVACKVMDNYGAMTATTNFYEISSSGPVPKLDSRVKFNKGYEGVFVLKNLGSAPYDFEVTDVPQGTIYPMSGTVPANPGYVSLYFRRGIEAAMESSLNINVKLRCNGEEYTVKLTGESIKIPPVSIQRPITVLEGEKAVFAGFGTQDGFDYRWTLGGEPLAAASKSLVWKGVPEGLLGSNVFGLQVLKSDGSLVTNLNESLVIKPRQPRVYLCVTSHQGLNVTFKPEVFHPCRDSFEVRYNYDEGQGWTVWQSIGAVSHDFKAHGSYLVRCQVRVGEETEETSLMLDTEKAFAPKVAFADGSQESACRAGEEVKIALSAEPGLSTLWREDFANPELGLLSDIKAQNLKVCPKIPGTYVFAGYALDKTSASAPNLLVLHVEGEESGPELSSETCTLSGVLFTNSLYGSGPLGNAAISVTAPDFFCCISNALNGTFYLDGLPRGKALVTILNDNCAGEVLEMALTQSVVRLDHEMTLEAGKSIIYAQLDGQRSSFPILGASLGVGSLLRTTSNKGRSGAFTVPYGQYVLNLIMPDGSIVYTNFQAEAKGKSKTISLAYPGFAPFIHGFLYGTGDEIVTAGQIQLLSEVTKNIVKRLELDGCPYYDFGLLEGHKVTLRYRPTGYDNENYTLTPVQSEHRDQVLTPEPALGLCLLALALFALRKKSAIL